MKNYKVTFETLLCVMIGDAKGQGQTKADFLETLRQAPEQIIDFLGNCIAYDEMDEETRIEAIDHVKDYIKDHW